MTLAKGFVGELPGRSLTLGLLRMRSTRLPRRARQSRLPRRLRRLPDAFGEVNAANDAALDARHLDREAKDAAPDVADPSYVDRAETTDVVSDHLGDVPNTDAPEKDALADVGPIFRGDGSVNPNRDNW